MKKENLPQVKKFMLKHPEVMHKLANEGLGHFMLFCLSHLFKYPFGIFQMIMMVKAENDDRNIVCPTYPDSYAEEIFMYSYVLWSVLGIKKFTNCVIVCGTREKAKEVYLKMKDEFLNNTELRKFDHKVTKFTCDGWNIFVPGYNARISIATYPMCPSRFRHKRRSPDIVIGCDLECLYSDTRAITRWMETELYDDMLFYEKTIVFGTVKKNSDVDIFEDIRKRGTDNDRRKPFNVVTVPCPLFDDDQDCLWRRRYTELEVQEMLKNWDDEAWRLKYLLHTIETFKVPKRFLGEDGTCDVAEYKKYLHEKYREELKATPPTGHWLFQEISVEVAEQRKADEYRILDGHYGYYGTGVVVKYEPED